MSICISIATFPRALSGSSAIAASHEIYVKEISTIASMPYASSTFVNKGNAGVGKAALNKGVVHLFSQKEQFLVQSGNGGYRR